MKPRRGRRGSTSTAGRQAGSASATAEGPGPPAKGRKRRTYLRAPERRRQILQAAKQVFSQSSFHGTRTRDIARAAEVNQATLFEHFESKEAIFQQAVVLPLLEAMHGMRERAEAYGSARSLAELKTLADATTRRHIQVMMEIFPLLTSALFSDLEAGRRLYLEHIVPLLEERGDAIGVMTKESLDPDFIQIASFGMLFALAMDAKFRGGTWDVSEIARQLAILSTTGFVKEFEDPDRGLAGSFHREHDER